MDYNSTREKLILPEYGRNVQQMVRHAVTIQDRAERNRCAKTIIGIMANMNPQMKDAQDFMHKLWDQLAIISEYKLDVDSPYPMPVRESLEKKPSVVPYEQHRIRMKHYGHYIQTMIDKAADELDPLVRHHLTEDIANYMKNSLLAWNKDFATDERLFSDIRILSGGRLEVDEDIKTAAYHKDHMNSLRQNNASGNNGTSRKKKKNNKNKNRNRNNY